MTEDKLEAAAHVPSIKFLVGSLFGGKTAMPKSSVVLAEPTECTKGYFKRKRRRKGPHTLCTVVDKVVDVPPRSNAQSSCKLKHYTHANMRSVPPIKSSRAGFKRLLPKTVFYNMSN